VAVIKAKPQKVVAFFLGMLERELIAPFVVTRVGQDFFKGAQNDTVTLRVSGLRAVARDYEFRTRTAPIVLDDIAGEDSIDVKLDTHVYSATALTDEQMTLDEINFATEVLGPQVEAVTGRLEAKVVAGLRGAQIKHTVTFGDGADPHLVALEARRLMSSEKVAPYAGRTFLVGSDIAANFLASDRLSRYDSTGQEGSPALRESIIGRLAGAPVVVHEGLDPDEGYYLHKSGLVLGNVAPVVPQGATAGRTGISKNGFAVRWIQDYDPNYLRDRSVVSSFAGVNDVQDERDLTDGTIRPDDYYPDGAGAGAATGPRNVRIVKLDFTGTGSVLTP
jgi:hypothetical protein